MVKLEIYDSTLRDGEQSAEASFSLEDRIKMCEELDNLGVDYIELGWPHASKEIFDSFQTCLNKVKNSRIVAFGSTSILENPEEDKNLNSLISSGANYSCIFGKSWKDQAEKQLNLNLEQNLERIAKSVKYLRENGQEVFFDAEHFFDGFKNDKNYALETIKEAASAGASRLVLCDTNGGTLPDEVIEMVKETSQYLEENGINASIGTHFHNDSGLALANSLMTLPYVSHVQGTINGMGERIGNLDLSQFIPNAVLKKGYETNINTKKLKDVWEESHLLSGKDIPEDVPFVGSSAFAHKGGVHADAIKKGAGYEHIDPELLGNERVIVLNTFGGVGGLLSVAEKFGYDLNKKDPKVREKVGNLYSELKEMEQKGYRVGKLKAEQFLLIEKYFGNLGRFFETSSWDSRTWENNDLQEGIRSSFYGKFNLNPGLDEEETIEKRNEKSGGPVDIAYKTYQEVLGSQYPEIKNLDIVNYHVGIARGSGEESSVRTRVWLRNEEELSTVGVSDDIMKSSIEAIEKGFRYYLNKHCPNK